MNEQVGSRLPASPVPPTSPHPSRGHSGWPFAVGLVVGLVVVALGVLPVTLRAFVGVGARPSPVPFPPGASLTLRPLGFLLFLLVAAALAWAVVRVRSRPMTPDAFEILRQRYARGEIGQEEYEARREVLRRG